MRNIARVKRSTYFDSITLMKIARELATFAGVEDVAVVMATRANLELLHEAGLAPFEGVEGTLASNDVLIVVRVGDEGNAEDVLRAAEERLMQRPEGRGGPVEAPTGTGPHQPRSLEQAVQLHPEARLAIISVPGMYAALEAEAALHAGLHVFLFSDNVSLQNEIALKCLARERGLLLMGPDCGTAMLNGLGLGFVNVVPRGAIGIVGASGTGTQQVMSLIAQEECGVSQVIGCGGRDLSEEIEAITTLQGLQLLQEDEQTQVIMLISKPPAPKVAERVLQAAAAGRKPVIVIFVGADNNALQDRYGEQVIITSTLAEASQQAVRFCKTGQLVRVEQMQMPRKQAPRQSGPPYLAALFSGGTLCDEALHIWGEQLGPIYSNIPLNPEWRLVQGRRVQAHYALDFGADEYTHGRPHPMIDPGLRLRRLQEEASNPQIGVILLDIVLGYCAHPNPASVYAPIIRSAIAEARDANRSLTCIISLCGTEGDPQCLSLQAAQFREVGAEVYTRNVDAAWRCIELLS